MQNAGTQLFSISGNVQGMAPGHPIFGSEAGLSVYHVLLEYFRNDVRARYRRRAHTKAALRKLFV